MTTVAFAPVVTTRNGCAVVFVVARSSVTHPCIKTAAMAARDRTVFTGARAHGHGQLPIHLKPIWIVMEGQVLLFQINKYVNSNLKFL